METHTQRLQDQLAEEETPLLRPSSNELLSNREAETARGDESPSTYRRVLFLGTATSLGLGISGLAFMLTSAILTKYGTNKFDFGESWRLREMREALGWAVRFFFVEDRVWS